MKQDKVAPNGASVTLVFLSSEKLEVSTAGGVSRLEISSLRDSDAGEYVCQLSLLTGLLSLHHTLDVLGSHCPITYLLHAVSGGILSIFADNIGIMTSSQLMTVCKLV